MNPDEFIPDPTPPTLCESCQFFSRGCGDSRSHPGEPDECVHPRHYALLTQVMRRAAIRNCRFHEPKS